MRNCRHCGKEFTVERTTGHNRQHCSKECARLTQKRNQEKFLKRNPHKPAEYAETRRDQTHRMTLHQRLRKKYPDLPVVCEAQGCEEDRVLDFAHKPAFARNGRHQTLNLYERHMFWVLCPTCHALIDRAGYEPWKLGLFE